MKKRFLVLVGILVGLLIYIGLIIQPDSKAPDISHPRVMDNDLLNYNKQIAETIESRRIDKTKTSVLIEKSKYRLTVFYDMKPIKSYPVVFGGNPVDDKLREGDCCTPEGTFKIRDSYPHQAWSKFLWINYPTDESWEKHKKAKQEDRISSDDSIGGEIGIHGVPEDKDYLIDEKSNWTLGCISLKNRDIDELYRIVRKGTSVEIVH